MATVQKVRKEKSRKNLFVRLIISALALYAVVALVDMQVTLAQKKQELEVLRVKYEQQRLDNKDLERLLNAEMSDDYIERYARDELGYVAPGEKVFIDISGS